MKYLIDTHILLWMASEQTQISSKIRKILSDEKCEIYLSVASIWEMAIKISLGKLGLPVELKQFIQAQVLDNGIILMSVKKEHTYLLTKLPFHHRDPFDRLLVSQSSVEDLAILTADKIFKKYDIQSIF